MPIRKKISRTGSHGGAISGSDKDTERPSGDVKRPPFRGLRSLSMSLPSKENRRLSLPSPVKKKYSNDCQSVSLDSSRLQLATGDVPGTEARTGTSGACNSSSKKADVVAVSGQTKNGVPRTIELQGTSDFLEGSLSHLDSPTFKVEDYCSRNHGAAQKKSTPIPIAQSRRKQFDMMSISELAESPRRYGLRRSRHVEEDVDGLQHSPSSLNGSVKTSLLVLGEGSNDNLIFNPPSSPLLMAVKKAVDSLNQYADFEIIEEIGSGFFADVFKVSQYGRTFTRVRRCHVQSNDSTVLASC